MPTLGPFTASLQLVGAQEQLDELDVRHPAPRAVSCSIAVPSNPRPDDDYGLEDVPYTICWSIAQSAFDQGGVQVQVEIDGCQKGQPRCYDRSAQGKDSGLWATSDGSRFRPYVFGPLKTAHPHSALADKAILDRIGSVRVRFVRAAVVPTTRSVPVTPPFNGGAPVPDRMRERISHWTKLGFIVKGEPAKEVGLVAEDVGETLAEFDFLYRAPHLLSKGLSFPPGTPDTRSIISERGPSTSPPARTASPTPPKRKEPSRVRTVSLKVAKRASMLGRSRSSMDGEPELATMEDLRKEVLRLRAEVESLKHRIA